MKFLGARLAVGLCLSASSAFAADKVSFGTNWLAEAEHGGYYQAVADGTYAKYGLDVTIVQGGPQANNELLLAAGQAGLLHGRQSSARLRRGRPQRADRRRRRPLPEGPADVHVASGRGPRQVDRPAERVTDDHRQGRAGHVLSMDEGRPMASRKRTSGPTRSIPGRSSPTRTRSSRATSPRSRSPSNARATSSRTSSCSPTTATRPTRRPSKRAPT